MSTDLEKVIEQLVTRLTAAYTSPTMGYYLQLPESMLKKITMGSMLLALCFNELKIPRALLAPPFFSQLSKRAEQFHPVPKSFYTYSVKKDDAIDLFRCEIGRAHV